MCRGEWPPSHVSDKSNGKRRIWVETFFFGVSHLASNRCLARKHTHTHTAAAMSWGDGLGSDLHFSNPRGGVGGRGLFRKGGRRGETPPAPAGRSDISATLPGVKPGPRDTTASPVPATGRRALRDEHPRAWCPGIPSRPRGGGCCGCVRGAARQRRPWPESRGPRRAAAMSPRSVPTRGPARQPRAPGRIRLTNAVVRLLSPFAGGCSWVCYRCIQPGAVS